jgi:hypothetical protein
MIKKVKKSGFLVIMTIVVLLASCSQGKKGKGEQEVKPGSSSDTASIFFREYHHDFGRIVEGEKVGYIFIFENKGVGPLVISSASASCGCTVPKFDKKPVLPGETGTIEVIFDSSGRNGMQTKTITVISNATKPVVLLRISGDVTTSNNN